MFVKHYQGGWSFELNQKVVDDNNNNKGNIPKWNNCLILNTFFIAFDVIKTFLFGWHLNPRHMFWSFLVPVLLKIRPKTVRVANLIRILIEF